MIRSTSVRALLLSACLPFVASALRAQDDVFAERLADGQSSLRKGELSAARAAFDEILEAEASDRPEDRPAAGVAAAARCGVFTIELRLGNYRPVRDEIAALPAAERGTRPFAMLEATAISRLGNHEAAAAILRRLVDADPADTQARHELGEALWRDGQRNAARKEWLANSEGEPPTDPMRMAFVARSAWRIGGRANFETASRLLVDAMAKAPELTEARTTFGILKFEAYGEAAGFPSGEKDLLKVLEQNGDDEEALLAMYRIRSANGTLDPSKTERYLDRVFERNPNCTAAIVLRASNVLDDRRYRDAAAMFDSALAIDPNDRAALCHRTAAAWFLHDDASYRAFRERALAGDPGWPDVDRVIGDHLVAMYRFADALPFYAAARVVAPEDVPTLHGMAKALVYTGKGNEAKELLLRAKSLTPGFNDPWRNNSLAVQQLLDDEYTLVEHDRFRLQVHRDDVEVLRAYLMPIQLEAAEVLGAKYGWSPDVQTKVEVLHKWDDFSVRTIGFRGFTALGACFGRLITLVSPVDTDLRKLDFMWEATAWHEYTHVLTLGLSKHRVPRWLTEGFSVYEEKMRDPSWERGMDRELFDAFHNKDIPPVRLLNRLYRGPRILFAYYQGGLLIEVITKHYGFEKALDLLRAFGEDLDTEEAFQKALGIPSSDLDAQLLAFVEREKLRGMRLVPHYDDARLQELLVRAGRDKSNVQVRIDLAWACLQRDNPADAGRWMAEVLQRDPDNGPVCLLRAEMLRRRGEAEEAIAEWKRGFERGADDFDARIACGDTMLAAGDKDGAEQQWLRAKACWPQCTDQNDSPELRLARLYREKGDVVRSQMEMKTFCRRTARAFAPRYSLAEFERQAGNFGEAVRYLVECNRIDPFHRELHVRLGEAYEKLGKKAQAALEFEVAAAVLPDFDRRFLRRDAKKPAADDPAEMAARGDLLLRAAELRHDIADAERAREILDRVRRELPRTDAAARADELARQWQGR